MTDPRSAPIPSSARTRPARAAVLISVLLAGGTAGADIARGTQEVLIPFDAATMTAEWIGPSVSLPGMVRWTSARDPAVGGTLFDVSEARPGDTAAFGGNFRAGESLLLSFGPSTRPHAGNAFGNGWQHHRTPVTAFENLSFGLEPAGPPRGRSGPDPFEQALFVLRFTNAPAPSAAAVLGLGGLMLAGRRRRPAG